MVALLGLAAFVLLAAILVPAMKSSYERQLEHTDDEYITSARRLADYTDFGEEELLVFDGINKSFVKAAEFGALESYTSSRKHTKDFVVAIEDGSGNKTCQWMSVDEIRRRAGGK